MHSGKDLFQLQTELNARRIDMAVSQAIERFEKTLENWRNELKRDINEIRNDITEIRSDITELRSDMAELKTELKGEINELRYEMHEFKSEMRSEFQAHKHEVMNEIQLFRGEVNERFVRVETKLGLVNTHQQEVRTRFIDYGFKSAWIVLGAMISYCLIHFHMTV